MRFLITIGFYILSYSSIGQIIYSPTGEKVTLGDTLKKVLTTFEAKKVKSEFYQNKKDGYAFGLDKFNRLDWFSINKATVIIGDGSIWCGMRVQDLKKIIAKQKDINVRLFSERFLYISELDNFPNTYFIVFFKDKNLAKKLRQVSETPYRNDNGMYNVPLEMIPDEFKINSIRVSRSGL